MLFRRNFRRQLEAANISYTEEKGFLDSQFIVEASAWQIDQIVDQIRKFEYRAAFEDYTFKVKYSQADELEKYIRLNMGSGGTMDRRPGLFRAVFDVRCHPTTSKAIQDHCEELNKIK